MQWWRNIRKISLALLAMFILIAGEVSAPTYAATPPPASQQKNKGLYVSPLRSYVTLNAGEAATRGYTVANLTDQTITVSAHIEQFSVEDYTYDYEFSKAANDWVKLVETTTTLKPNQSHTFPYRISLPANASPGGHYYTLYASSSVVGSGTNTTIQATTLLYLTVNGDLSRTAQVISRSVPSIVISPDISYGLNIKNTGNIHFFALISPRVDGLLYANAPSGSSQLLLPGSIRHVDASIRSPLIPGIYKFSYTITPDQGNSIGGSQYVLFLPPWSIALLIIILAVIGNLLYTKLKKRESK